MCSTLTRGFEAVSMILESRTLRVCALFCQLRKTNHRGTETQRKHREEKTNVVFLLCAFSVPLWFVFALLLRLEVLIAQVFAFPGLEREGFVEILPIWSRSESCLMALPRHDAFEAEAALLVRLDLGGS